MAKTLRECRKPSVRKLIANPRRFRLNSRLRRKAPAVRKYHGAVDYAGIPTPRPVPCV